MYITFDFAKQLEPIMDIKTFVLYFSPYLVSAIGAFAITKQISVGLSNMGKKPVIYGTVSSLLFSGLAFIATFITKNLFTIFWILSGLFLLFGLIHFSFTHKKYFSHPRENKTKGLIAEFLFAFSLICFCVTFFASAVYFLKDKSFLFYPMLFCTLFFFSVPLVYYNFQTAYSIPAPVFTTWSYPLGKTIELPDEKENELIYVIGFELVKNLEHTDRRTYFTAKAPADMILGDLFYHFINDYNEQQSETPIEYTRKDVAADEWVFRTRPKWYQFSRILDPYKSVAENRIRENAIIICDRV